MKTFFKLVIRALVAQITKIGSTVCPNAKKRTQDL